MERNLYCSKCGKDLSDDSYIEDNGKIHCIDCQLRSTCDCCGELTQSDSLNYLEYCNEYICDSCLEEHYTKCDYCGDYFLDTDLTEVENYGLVCNDCLNREFTECAHCGNWIYIDDGILEQDELICEECYSESSGNTVQCYHFHHNNAPIFFGDNNYNAVPYLGVELEIDESDNIMECAKAIKDVMPEDFVYMEHDGSLENGFEIITQPATFKYHCSIENRYNEMSKIALKYGFRSHDTITCGLHVHFNRDYFSFNVSQQEYELRIMKLLYLVEKFWNELTKFSRRSQDSLKRWADKYDESPENIVENMKASKLARYKAVNLTNENTIEFRLFKGTLKISTFMATLEMCNNLIQISKNTTNIEDLQNIKWEDLLTSESLKNYWESVKNRR